MARILPLAMVLAAVVFAAASACGQEPAERRPDKMWIRSGGLGETPVRVTDNLPLSDQENRGNWVPFDPMSDEFEGDALDLAKWTVGMDPWLGRPPGLFRPENVAVSGGKLHLTMRKEQVPAEYEARGFKDYTSAALHTKTRAQYGYFEVKAKPMDSGGSSSFWFKRGEVPGWNTEIDVFEIGGKAKGFEQRYNMHVHVFQTPTSKEHWQMGGAWEAPWRLADDYHVYGFEWGPDLLRYYVDGVLVGLLENTHWHQPLALIFDSETMPDWMGMPEDEDLPSTYSIEYVRAWQTQYDEGWIPLFNGKDLDGWSVKCREQDRDKTGYWKVENGTITAETPAGSKHHYIWLLSDREFADFELRLKVQTYADTTGNSGIQLRSRYDDTEGWLDGPQVDLNPPGPWRNGFIYDETRGAQVWLWPDVGRPANAKPEHAPEGWNWEHADGKDVWNDVRVVCRGMQIQTFMNGVPIADYDGTGRLDDAAHRARNVGLRGHIGLQIHPGNELLIRFKEIEVRELR